MKCDEVSESLYIRRAESIFFFFQNKKYKKRLQINLAVYAHYKLLAFSFSNLLFL